MSSSTLYRLSGGTLIAASLLILVNSILSNVLFSGGRNTTPQQYMSLPWLLVTLVSPIGSLLFVIGLPGMYLRQAGRAGVLGLVDFILVFFDFLLGAAFSTLQVTALPLLAQVAPKLLEGEDSPPPCLQWHARPWWASKPRWSELESTLGAVSSLVLHCSQRTQRGLLRLSQALDARDIEALVRPVAAQRAEMLATLEFPERDDPVIPATGQPTAIGTPLERLDCPLMRFSHPHALPAVHLPPAHPAVTASTEHQLSTGSPAQRRDHPRMPRQGALPCITSPPERVPGRVALPAVGIPHHQLPGVAAAAARGQPGAIGAPGHARDGPLVSRQSQERRPIRGVPHIHVAIITPADQPRPVRTPGHATDPGHVRMTHPPWVTLGHVPHQHALQKGSAGQLLSIGTPGHAVKDGLGVVEVAEDLHTGAGSWVPQPDGIVPPATGQPAPIGTPRDAVHIPAMSAQHPGRRPTGHLPDGHQRIHAATDQLGAVRTPGYIVEGGGVALHDPQRLATLHVPQPQRAIVAATEQAAAVGGEGQAVHHGAMALQCRPRCALLAIPQPDPVVKAATGQRASIRTPGHAMHLIRMPHKRLQTASASLLPHLPELDGAIPARAGEPAAIGGKGQSPHPVAMPPERLHAGSRPSLLPLPQPNRARDVATGEQSPIRTPGQ